jgi:hypothetical protein
MPAYVPDAFHLVELGNVEFGRDRETCQVLFIFVSDDSQALYICVALDTQ